MKNILNKIINDKKLMYFSVVGVLVLFSVVLNAAFAAFTASARGSAANFKVGSLEYSTTLNGVAGNVITATKNDIVKTNIVLTANNLMSTKYELTYEICTNSGCTSKLDSVNGLKVEYSSETIDEVSGQVSMTGSKTIRIVVTNTTNTTYYIRLGINAGFANQPIILQKQINNEYSEKDLTIYTYVYGKEADSFPTTKLYNTNVECKNPKGQNVSATGVLAWDTENSKWLLSVTNLDIGETRCYVYFEKAEPKGWSDAASGTLLAGIKANQAEPNADDATGMTVPGRELATTNEGLRLTPDDYGTSYYYRGAIENNYVVFAQMCWRIVRIDGNGNIKLVLYYNKLYGDGVTNPCNQTGNSLAFARLTGGYNPGPFNTTYNRNTYVGYMYSNTPDSTDYLQAHANDKDSSMLTSLKTWYDANFSDAQKNLLADTIWCNDKRLGKTSASTTNAGTGYVTTYYAAYDRLNTPSTAEPSLKCGESKEDNKISKFTAQDSEYGNAKLYTTNNGTTKYYKIGALTADEIAYAGNMSTQANGSYYLSKNASSGWWTLSPLKYNTWAYIFNVTGGINGDYNVSRSTILTRPSISLTSTARIVSGGNGTVESPFVIVES